jgi:hypothetical protein
MHIKIAFGLSQDYNLPSLSSRRTAKMGYDEREALYDRCVDLITDFQRETENWHRTGQLLELLSDVVPAATGGEAEEYWFKSPDSHRLADAVITKLQCPAVTEEIHAAIVKMTAEWTQEASKLEEWQGRHHQ